MAPCSHQAPQTQHPLNPNQCPNLGWQCCVTCQQTGALFTLCAACQNQENKKKPRSSSSLREEGNTRKTFFSSSLVLHPAQSPSSGLPPSAHIGLSLILFLSCALSLCGILAAILALGSHLSFGGTHAFLLADGTPTHTHRNRHTCLQSTLALKHRPSGLKDKKTYRGRAALTQGRLFTVL